MHTGIQTTIPTKSQGSQCTLLRDFFVTSTPSQSEDEMSEGDPEEEMDADDDPSYVPDPEEETDDDEEFDDFDDCFYEWAF